MCVIIDMLNLGKFHMSEKKLIGGIFLGKWQVDIGEGFGVTSCWYYFIWQKIVNKKQTSVSECNGG